MRPCCVVAVGGGWPPSAGTQFPPLRRPAFFSHPVALIPAYAHTHTLAHKQPHQTIPRQLRVLRLGWNSLGLRAARALSEGLKLCSTLEELHLGWSGVTDTGAAHISKV